MKQYRFKGTHIVPTIDGSKIQIADKTIFSVNRNKLIYGNEEFILKAVTMKEVLANSVELTHNTKLYPSVAMPCTKADISRMYTLFNKKLFDNECPPISDVKIIKYKATAESPYAKARVRNIGDKVEISLMYSEKAMKTLEFFCDVIIHEMIHILHQKRAYLDKDPTYLNAGHGPLFKKDRDRINALGYNILLTVDSGKDISGDYQVEKHVIVVSGFDVEVAFYSNDPINVDLVLNQLRSTGFSPVYYYTGTTSDTKTLAFAMGLTSNQKLTSSMNKFVYRNLGFFSSTVRHGEVTHLDVTPHMQGALHHCRKFVEYGWEDYKYAALRAAKLNAYTPESDAKVKYFRAAWEGMSDTDLKRSAAFKEIYDRTLKEDWSDETVLKLLATQYKRAFKDRFTIERYVDVCVSKFDIVTMSSRDFKTNLTALINKGG